MDAATRCPEGSHGPRVAAALPPLRETYPPLDFESTGLALSGAKNRPPPETSRAVAAIRRSVIAHRRSGSPLLALVLAGGSV